MDEYNNILLFDGICNLCNGLVKFIIRRDHDKRILIIPLQSDEGKMIVKKVISDSEDIKTVVYITGNSYFLRSSAIIRLIRDLGGLWKLFYCLIIIPQFLRDPVYDLIAGYRYKLFGKRESCTITSKEMAKRLAL